jgi:RNA polymerase sigma-70 factor (ECF subfamily)
MNMNKNDISRLWDELTPKLFGYLVNTLHDKSLAEDILQTSWLKAIEALPSFKQQGPFFSNSFSSWIFAIARNECKQHWRKSGREIPLDEKIHDVAEVSSGIENKILVDEILNQLPNDDQELIRLRYIADLSTREIAKVLNINPVVARVRLHRAIVLARKCLVRGVTQK